MLRYAISNGNYQPGSAARWIAQKVDFIQLREKSMDAEDLTALASSIMEELRAAGQTRPRLLINCDRDDPDMAVESGADGVHLTSHPDELTVPEVHEFFAAAKAPRPIVSISCHTLGDVRFAAEDHADLILFGPVFEKRVAKQVISDGSGLELLSRAARAANGVPVLALGGVTHENTPACLSAGAKGIAAIRLFSE